MNAKIIRIPILLAVLFLFSTCGYNTVDPGICFQENVLPIFVSKCSMSGCHNSKDHEAGYDLSTYEGIMKGVKANHPFQSEVYTTIRGNNPEMPRGQKLSSLEVDYIKIWIKTGAQNTSNCLSCDTIDYSYTTRIEPLFTNWCKGCHNASTAGGGFDFSSYSGVAAAVNGNKLMGSINHLNGFAAMPQNADKMNDCSIKAIQKWVDNGFPNN